MIQKNIKSRIVNKHAIESDWIKATNFVPLQGELIIYDIEIDADGNTLALPEGRTTPYTYERFKIGDGITNVNELPFANEGVDLSNYYTKTETTNQDVAILHEAQAYTDAAVANIEIPTVPTKVSAFENDKGYLTEHQSLKTINGESLVGEGDIVIESGADGYTPVRGTDYWTEADKAEIKAYVDEAILGGSW